MRRIIRCDGSIEELPAPLGLRELARLIGADTLDTVNLRHMGDPLHVMLVDDHGYETEVVDHGGGHIELKPVRARKPLNPEATRLYLANCTPDTEHQVVGDVAIVPDEDSA